MELIQRNLKMPHDTQVRTTMLYLRDLEQWSFFPSQCERRGKGDLLPHLKYLFQPSLEWLTNCNMENY